MTLLGVLARTSAAVDPDQARRLLEHELERPEYDAAHATWWDRASAALLQWIGSLRLDGGIGSPGLGRVLLVVGIVVLVAVVVLVVVARGLPRRRARGRAAASGGVFDASDVRSAHEIADAARAALRAHDWETAVLDGYRALARGLGERDLVPDVPGATAHAIADRATTSFPQLGDRLVGAATTFDAVRYLGVPADEPAALAVLETERTVAAARPLPALARQV